MILPMLQLRTRDGAPFSWQGLWQRRNVLVLIAHPDCPSCRKVLADWDEQSDALAAENTVPVAVFPADPGDLPDCVQVAIDPEGRLAKQLRVEPGTVLAADRFFEILDREDVHAQGPDEAAAGSFDWLRLAERKCDECGVGTW